MASRGRVAGRWLIAGDIDMVRSVPLQAGGRV
jgi:hypothetical protein